MLALGTVAGEWPKDFARRLAQERGPESAAVLNDAHNEIQSQRQLDLVEVLSSTAGPRERLSADDLALLAEAFEAAGLGREWSDAVANDVPDALARTHRTRLLDTLATAPTVNDLCPEDRVAMMDAGFISAGGRILWARIYGTTLVEQILFGGLPRSEAESLGDWWQRARRVQSA